VSGSKTMPAVVERLRPARVEVAIEELSGPFGLGRYQGRVLMVPGTVPGDLIEAEIERDRGTYALATLRRVIEPAPARRSPPCPFLPRCGGCDWQQVVYPAQLAAKGRLLAQQFERGLGLRLQTNDLVQPAPREFGYRARVRLQVSSAGLLGFYRTGTNDLVPIDQCLLTVPELNLDVARAVVAALPGCEELELVAAGVGPVAVAILNRRAQEQDQTRATRAIAQAGLAGLVVRARDRRIAVGEVETSLELEPGLELRLAADAFSQVNHQANRALIAAVLERVAQADARKVLDLYCGAGNFSLPLARRGLEVLGVDADALAIEAAERNARRLALPVRFVAMRAAELAPFLLRAGYRPDLALLDPPRGGARPLMASLGRLRPRQVVYVSCDCATVVRDLRLLCEQGYRLESVRGFDFFPNTHHLEVVAVALLT